MKKFSDRIAVVTGAASGIGRCLALQLAERGCILALADKNMEGLKATGDAVSEYGGRYSLHELDVSDREAMEAFADNVVSTHGGVHLLFNNAGVTAIDHIDTMDYANFEWVMNINFWGVVYGTKAFLPHLKKSDEAHITNISSLFGLLAVPSQGAYNASKFAVRGFTEALKMELADTQVGVSSVHPGGIKTSIVRNARVAEGSMAVTKKEIGSQFDSLAKTTADKAASVILNGIEKNRRRILVGWDAKILDLIVRLFPASYEYIARLEKPLIAKVQVEAEAESLTRE